jgi:hypothetical protein
METVGSSDVLPVLEAINHELGATLQARRLFGDSLGAISEDTGNFSETLRRKLPGLEAESRAKFLEAVSLAVEAIRIRSENPAKFSPEPDCVT